jgi:putative restriction endonuclease
VAATPRWAVKHVHDYNCQVCGTRLITPAGPYAEGAHIRALGIPHNGPDVLENLLCLCPNDHVRFDAGAIYIDDTLLVRESASDMSLGALRLRRGHTPNRNYLTYHREYFAAP